MRQSNFGVHKSQQKRYLGGKSTILELKKIFFKKKENKTKLKRK